MSVRALATLFEVARHEDGSSREISVAMLEVYNETVRNLVDFTLLLQVLHFCDLLPC